MAESVPETSPRNARNRAEIAGPLGRPGTVEKAVDAALLFCPPLSESVTGRALICGGLHI
jgi:hypothetical protein